MSKSEDQEDQNQYQNQSYDEVQDQDRIENLNQIKEQIEYHNENQPHDDAHGQEQIKDPNQNQEQTEDLNQSQTHKNVKNQEEIEDHNQNQNRNDVNSQYHDENQPHEDVNDQEQIEDFNQNQLHINVENQKEIEDLIHNQEQTEELNQNQPHENINDQDSRLLNEIKESQASNNQPRLDATFLQGIRPRLRKIPKLRILNPYLPMELQNLRDRKIRNDADIVPKSEHPISDPLLGHQNLAEDFYENAPKENRFISDTRDSYPFAFVSSEDVKTPFQDENEISDVVSNRVKWAYMEKAYGYPLRHERNKLSVTLVRNQKSIEKINLDNMYLAIKQKNKQKRYKSELKANFLSSELTLFEVIYFKYPYDN